RAERREAERGTNSWCRRSVRRSSFVHGVTRQRVSRPLRAVILLLPFALTADRVALARRVVQDEVAFSVVDNDGPVRAATPPVGHDAFRADRIRSGKVRGPTLFPFTLTYSVAVRFPLPSNTNRPTAAKSPTPMTVPVACRP